MKEIKKRHVKFSKKTLNVIRTTERNNIDLINIADNKASILLSLNAIIITVLLPTILAHFDTIIAKHLYFPISLLALTSFVTIILCAYVLRPISLSKNQKSMKGSHKSPFFFGNYYKLKPEEYLPYVEQSLGDEELVSEYVLQDLYFKGKLLGQKYFYIRKAFEIFVFGIGASLVITIVVLAFI